MIVDQTDDIEKKPQDFFHRRFPEHALHSMTPSGNLGERIALRAVLEGFGFSGVVRGNKTLARTEKTYAKGAANAANAGIQIYKNSLLTFIHHT